MDIPRTEFLKNQRKRRVVIAAGGALALAGVAFAIARLEPATVSAAGKSLLIGTVQRGEFVREVRGPGLLIPKEIRWIAAQAPGRVERLVLKPGAVVEADSVIVELTNPELERVVQEAEWAVTQSEAEVAAVRLQLKGQVLDQRSNLAEARATYESTRLQAEAEAEAARTHAVSQLQARRSQILAEQLAVRVEVEEDRLANLADATHAQLRAQSARLEQAATRSNGSASCSRRSPCARACRAFCRHCRRRWASSWSRAHRSRAWPGPKSWLRSSGSPSCRRRISSRARRQTGDPACRRAYG